MKHLFRVVLILLFVFLLASCAKDEVTPLAEDSLVEDTQTIERKQQNKDILEVNKTDNHSPAQTENADDIESKEKAAIENDTEDVTVTEENSMQSSGKASTDSSKTPSKTAESKDENSKETKYEKTNGEREEKTERQKEQEVPETKEQKQQEETPKTEPVKTVTVTISAPDVKGTILSVTSVPIKDGDTVLDATLKIVNERGIQISVRGSGASAYVEGIANLYEFDEGPLSGWKLLVGGQEIDRSAGAFTISEGQAIHWKYTTNYLEE